MISSAIAQTTQSASNAAQTSGSLLGGGGDWSSMIPFAILFVLMYFMFIRPQQKRQKEHKTMIDSLQTGDEVLLAGGIIARIKKLDDQYLIVEIAKDVDIRVQRNAVSAMLPKNAISTD